MSWPALDTRSFGGFFQVGTGPSAKKRQLGPGTVQKLLEISCAHRDKFAKDQTLYVCVFIHCDDEISRRYTGRVDPDQTQVNWVSES